MADSSVVTADTTVKRHPIAAVLWGIVGGIGISLILIGRAQIAFGKWLAPIIIIVIMVVLNLLWAYFGPAKKPKGPPPVRMEPEPVPMYEATFGTGSDSGPGSGSDEIADSGPGSGSDEIADSGSDEDEIADTGPDRREDV